MPGRPLRMQNHCIYSEFCTKPPSKTVLQPTGSGCLSVSKRMIVEENSENCQINFLGLKRPRLLALCGRKSPSSQRQSEGRSLRFGMKPERRLLISNRICAIGDGQAALPGNCRAYMRKDYLFLGTTESFKPLPTRNLSVVLAGI